MSKRPRGRPTKRSTATTCLIVAALEHGASRARAASYAGLDERTLRLWRRQGLASESGPYRELVERMEIAEALGRERSRVKPCVPVPVAVEKATVRVFKDQKIAGRRPVKLDIEALRVLVEKTCRTQDQVGCDSTWMRLNGARSMGLGPRAKRPVADNQGGTIDRLWPQGDGGRPNGRLWRSGV